MHKTFIIAEAGVNHNGRMDLAQKLVDIAAEAGCDAVKFQAFNAQKLVTASAPKAEYQKRNTGEGQTQLEMLKALELGIEEHRILAEYSRHKNIIFMSSPFDEDSSDMLEKIGMKVYKIPSGEVTNKPLIKHIAKKGKALILSTGMATLGEVEEALFWVKEEENTDISLLHCTSNYPTAMEEVNLRAMNTLRNAFQCRVGYSDHTLGIEVATAAVALGAEIIEKHFTIDKSMEGPDHKASLDPLELKKLVTSIRNIERALGNGLKVPTPGEISTREIARKSIVAAKQIRKGDIITADKLTIKRPGTGIAPKHIGLIVGRISARDIMPDEIISYGDFC